MPQLLAKDKRRLCRRQEYILDQVGGMVATKKQGFRGLFCSNRVGQGFLDPLCLTAGKPCRVAL